MICGQLRAGYWRWYWYRLINIFPACRAVRLGVVYFTQSSVIITRWPVRRIMTPCDLLLLQLTKHHSSGQFSCYKHHTISPSLLGRHCSPNNIEVPVCLAFIANIADVNILQSFSLPSPINEWMEQTFCRGQQRRQWRVGPSCLLSVQARLSLSSR